MPKLKQLWDRSWKGVTTIVSIIAIVTALVAFDARYAKPADVKNVEQKVVQTLDQFKTSLQLRDDITRLDAVNNQLMQTKIQLRNHPNDQDLKDDYEALKQQKIKLQEKIDKSATK
jgi:hypothetical protein